MNNKRKRKKKKEGMCRRWAKEKKMDPCHFLKW
jgi:hypothetical protein